MNAVLVNSRLQSWSTVDMGARFVCVATGSKSLMRLISMVQVAEKAAADAGAPSPPEAACGPEEGAARPMDVDAGSSDAAGSAPPVQHKPPAPSTTRSWVSFCHYCNFDRSACRF